MKIVNKVLISVLESDIIDGKFTNKEVTSVADKCFYELRNLRAVSLPKVEKIGNYCFSSNDALTSISLRNKEYNVKSVDGTCYVVVAEKSSKGIKIYTGYNLVNISNGILNKQAAFVAEKEGFYAHGETVKKAISDLQFKIVAEKLSKEPIQPDTIITVNHYRLITGACEMGVKSWMQSTFTDKEFLDISENGIKAELLLPLLKRNKAYGLDRFKSMITF